MKNHDFIDEKMLEATKPRAELRFFTGPDTDAPETELEDCRIPVRLDLLGTKGRGEIAVQFSTLESKTIPTHPPRVARWMDLFVEDRRVARTDFLAWAGYGPRSSGFHLHQGGGFALDVEDPA